jgi:Ca-activated chloride channel family protein
MTPEQNGHEPHLDSPELQQFAYAIDDLDAAEQDAVEQQLASNPAAKQTANETRRLADAMRHAYLVAPAPIASGSLHDVIEHAFETKLAPKTAIPKERSRRFEIALVVGVVASLILIVSTLVYLNQSDSHSPIVQHTPQMQAVPLAKSDLPPGKTIETGDIVTVHLTEEEMRRRNLPLDLVMVDENYIVGRTPRKPIRQGQPFLTTDLYLESGAPNWPLKPGYRAVNVSVSELNGGKFKPGDHIDLWFTSDAKKAGPGHRAVPEKTIKVVDSIEIVDVWRPDPNAAKRANGHDPAVTLIVKAEDAPKMYALQAHGKFKFFKSESDDVAKAEGHTMESLLGLNEEAAPPPTHTLWTTEYSHGRSVANQRVPVRLPSPEQVAAYEAARAQLAAGIPLRGALRTPSSPDDSGAAVTIGLDPASSSTSDFEVGFINGEARAPFPVFPERPTGEGIGPHSSGDKYNRIYENDFKAVGDNPLSTFSIDVDTASYSKVRQYLMAGQLPPPDAVRIEELVNYFPYDYLAPMGDEKPFTAHMEVCECPWKPEHRLARIAIKGKEIKADKRPVSNLVFLIDVSGSMNEPNRLPLVIKGMKMLVEQLGEHDRVAMVVYAGAAGLVLPSTPGNERKTIIDALEKLSAGGSTAGGEGLKLAYQTAKDNFIEGGTNRVLLCTDGDFNVGVSDTAGIVRMAEEEAKNRVFLSILGFGIGNLNDSMLEQVANKANGMYAFIDTENEARKVLVEQLSGTLVTIAKDVKIQIEFNPKKVAAYRLIGYENRLLAAEDFNDDTKDAGEIGAGHNVTALYEIVPAAAETDVKTPEVDELKYQTGPSLTKAADSDELLTLKLRYKMPDGDTSWLQSFPVSDNTQRFSHASDDFQFAAAVASFGMLLRGSAYKGNATFDAVHEIAGAALGEDEAGYRKEFLTLVEKAKALAP